MTHKIGKDMQWKYVCGKSIAGEGKEGRFGDWLWRNVTCETCLKTRDMQRSSVNSKAARV